MKKGIIIGICTIFGLGLAYVCIELRYRKTLKESEKYVKSMHDIVDPLEKSLEKSKEPMSVEDACNYIDPSGNLFNNIKETEKILGEFKNERI